MFERRHEKLAPLPIFLRRMAGSASLGLGMLLLALSLGIFGYHWIGGLDWVDSLLEASMILGGMGPINPLTSTSAKIFASVYALFSGVVFIAIMGFLLAPIVHRVMHKFHLKDS
ncbi:MAG TPA: hypothetical protein VHR36_02480 [Pyrinomonadaceae bacterium]|nr:hypothetical protein [Pyrinomonadaceae bacterium]